MSSSPSNPSSESGSTLFPILLFGVIFAVLGWVVLSVLVSGNQESVPPLVAIAGAVIGFIVGIAAGSALFAARAHLRADDASRAAGHNSGATTDVAYVPGVYSSTTVDRDGDGRPDSDSRGESSGRSDTDGYDSGDSSDSSASDSGDSGGGDGGSSSD